MRLLKIPAEGALRNPVLGITVAVLSCFLLAGCVKKSVKRPAEPQAFNLSKNVSVASTGVVNMNVPLIVNNMDFLPSSFIIRSGELVIYIDPFAIDEGPPADYILITHPHPDHFSLQDIKKIAKNGTVIICPKTVSKSLSKFSVKEIKPGETFIFKDFSCEAVPAYNLKPGFLGITPHPKAGLNAGYVISVNGFRIFHAGDSDYVPEMDNLKDIDMVMLPIAGGKLTMSTEKAAELANKLQPSIAVPMHYETGKSHVDLFRKLIRPGIKVIVLDGDQ